MVQYTMLNHPVLRLSKVQSLEDIYGYICSYHYDEDNVELTYLSEFSGDIKGDKRVQINDGFILNFTGIDYSFIRENILLLNDKERKEYINMIPHPLVKYKATFEFCRSDKEKEEVNLLGAKVLLNYNIQYHKENIVSQTSDKWELMNKKPLLQVADIISTFSKEQYISSNREKIYDYLVIKKENIPITYLQKLIERERNNNSLVESDDSDINKLSFRIIQKQKESIDKWLDYLETQYYPDWYNLYIIEGLKRLGHYDPVKDKFTRRRKNCVNVFPPLDVEAISKMFFFVEGYNKGESEYYHPDFIEVLQSGNFARIYDYTLKVKEDEQSWDKKNIKGKWVHYPSTLDPNIAFDLSKSVRMFQPGWCTSNMNIAQEQLEKGDLHIYYTEDLSGEMIVPRIAIRTEKNLIVEIRGIEKDQNLETVMSSIVKEKLKEFSEQKEYTEKISHLEMLSVIEKKHEDNVTLTKKEISFLYEIEGKIKGFGYEENSLITQIRNERRIEDDLADYFDISPDEIIIGDVNISKTSISNLETIKYVHGTVTILEEVLIPNSLKAKCIVIYSEDLQEIPLNLQAKELYVDETNINKIPNNLKLKELHASYTPLEELPKGLDLDVLDISGTMITHLPKNIRIKNLYMYDSCMQELSADLEAEELYMSKAQEHLYSPKIHKKIKMIKSF